MVLLDVDLDTIMRKITLCKAYEVVIISLHKTQGKSSAEDIALETACHQYKFVEKKELVTGKEKKQTMICL